MAYITVAKQTTQTVYKTVKDATYEGYDAVYTPATPEPEPEQVVTPSAAPAADPDCD